MDKIKWSDEIKQALKIWIVNIKTVIDYFNNILAAVEAKVMQIKFDDLRGR